MTILCFFLWPSIGWSLETDSTGISNPKKITSIEKVTTAKVYPEKLAMNILVKPESRLQKQNEESVSVIKSIELGPLLDSFYKKHRTRKTKSVSQQLPNKDLEEYSQDHCRQTFFATKSPQPEIPASYWPYLCS